MDKMLSPIHPGEVLLEDFMKPLGLSQYRLAKEYALALLMEFRRLHPAPPLSSGTKVKD